MEEVGHHCNVVFAKFATDTVNAYKRANAPPAPRPLYVAEFMNIQFRLGFWA
jgi:hypothetical protein